MRVCKKCLLEKELSLFCSNKNCKEGKTYECLECAAKRKYKWREENLTKSKISYLKWRAKNLDRLREYGRFNTRRWAAKNPIKIKEYSVNRRGRKKAQSVYLVSNKDLVKLYSKACIYCGSKNNIEIDHVIPLSKGGNHSIGNLVPACRICNASKKDRYITEWKVKWQKYL